MTLPSENFISIAVRTGLEDAARAFVENPSASRWTDLETYMAAWQQWAKCQRQSDFDALVMKLESLPVNRWHLVLAQNWQHDSAQARLARAVQQSNGAPG